MNKYEILLWKMRKHNLLWDNGIKGEQIQRIMLKCKYKLKTQWENRSHDINNKKMQNYMM